MTLNTSINIARPDDFYERLIDMYRDMTPEQSSAANAALILLLANHVGNADVLMQAVEIARQEGLQAA